MPEPTEEPAQEAEADAVAVPAVKAEQRPLEFGGPRGPEPTRYGDWERNGRCIDF